MYKSLLSKLFLLVSFIAFFSCDKDGKIEYLPFKSSSDGKWGMVGTDGKLLFEEEFKKQPTIAINGRFMVHADKGWEVYSAEKNPKLIGDGYLQIADFTADVTPAVKKNGHICLINKDCEVVVELEKAGNKPIVKCSRFRKGFAIITTDDNKEGVINTSGTVVVEPKYKEVFIISPNMFFAMNESNGRTYKVSYIDGHGETKCDMEFGEGKKYMEPIPNASTDEYVAVRTEDREHGYIDYKGNVVVKPSSRIKGFGGSNHKYNIYKAFEAVRNDKFIYSDGDKYGVMDFEGNAILKARYSLLFWACDDVLVAGNDRDKVCRLIDVEGEKMIDDDYGYIFSFDEKHVFVSEGEHDYTFMKMKGKNKKIDNVPDIYYLELDFDDCLASTEVRSQYVDLDGIIEKLQIHKNSLMGYNLEMMPREIVNTAKKDDNNISGDPSDYDGRSSFRQNKDYYGYDIEFEISMDSPWGEGMSITQNNGKTVWSSYKPSDISVRLQGSMIDEEKAKKMYSKIATILKANGKTVKEESTLMVINVNNSFGWYLARWGDGLTISLMNKNNLDSYLGINNGYYDHNPNQSFYNSSSSNTGGEQYVVINGVGVRFRFGPSLDDGYLTDGNGKTKSVPKGTKLPYLGEEGNWYKVSYSNQSYYVSKDFSYLSY